MAEKDKVSVYRIPPYNYLHVLDQNTNVTRVEQGPKTFVRQDHEKVILSPTKMVIVPPQHYCIIENPVARDESGSIILDDFGQPKLRHADLEVRLTQDPFALFPGELLATPPTKLTVVKPNTALRLRATSDFKDTSVTPAVDRLAGDEWLFEGPGTYIPKVEVEIMETVTATVVNANQAIRLRARLDCKSKIDNVQRYAGEEWIVKANGAYLPGVYEKVVSVVNAVVLTDSTALHLRALRTFTDSFGKKRKNGEEWLVTNRDTESHIPSVYEEIVSIVKITTLTSRQYCVIENPADENGVNHLGKRKLVKGEVSFFLQPGESLARGIEDIYILGSDEGLVLRAVEEFDDVDADGKAVKRRPGDTWMIHGPCEYTPPTNIEVVDVRKAIPLDDNEGIYVRDMRTGRVRAICAQTYMLKENEELFNKELPPEVENLLSTDPLLDRFASSSKNGGGAKRLREKHSVITYRVPHNACVQIYDYKEKRSRVEFGPDLVMLQPDEMFTMMSLSGGKPKRPNQIRTLCLLLGPDFCTDIITVETADHARLSLQLSYNWHFDVDRSKDSVDAGRLFSVPDFIGDSCKAIASKIRGAVASATFDDFHKSSARIICTAVFGLDEHSRIRDSYRFPANNLVITSVDIQSVEPVDQRTRDSLQKSVQLAIEITTNSQEAAAKHEAERIEQEARGRIERQKIKDEAEAEEARRRLLLLQAESAAVEAEGHAKAEAKARAEATTIEGQAAVEHAKLRAESAKIEADAELERLTKARNAEIDFVRRQNELEYENAKRLSDLEIQKFKEMVTSIGPQTLVAMAQAGPEMQVKLLQSLGIQSTLITDGHSPINLFQTAQGLVPTSGHFGNGNASVAPQ